MQGEFIQYKFCGSIIGMNHIYIIKPVIPQNIDHEFIGWKIMNMIKFICQVMNRFYQSCLAAVIVYETVPDMANGANRKDNLNLRIELEQLMDAVIKAGIDLLNCHEVFIELLSRCAVTVCDRSIIFQKVVRKGRPQCNDQPAGVTQKMM